MREKHHLMSSRYGFMKEPDCDVFDKAVDLAIKDFGFVRFLEVGTMTGDTAFGVADKCKAAGKDVYCAGVDIQANPPEPPPTPNYEFHKKDSMDAWRDIHGEFNLLFIDGCHCANHVMCDFLNYSFKVVVGGYCLFHDTALPKGKPHQEPMPQDHSYAGQPDSYYAAREGVRKLGLISGYRTDWELIDESKHDDGYMGMMLFRKTKAITEL